MLQWMRAQDPPCPWNERTCSDAAKGGHLHVLQWLRAQDPPCPWDERTCAAAAEDGNLHVLQWMRAQDPPCPWDEVTCSDAAKGGHLHVLQWACRGPAVSLESVRMFACSARTPLPHSSLDAFASSTVSVELRGVESHVPRTYGWRWRFASLLGRVRRGVGWLHSLPCI